ncbi:MAG: MFS transporter [Dehalococcoidales bacterium]|jgi:MFS family permease
MNKSRKKILGFSPNVFFLGIVSFLTDVSSEMIFTLIPLFLSNVMGVGATFVGLVGGISESTDAVLRILSGWLSDRLRRYKALALVGYGLSTVAKPFMYLAASWGAVLAIRLADRMGKGVRSSPRDALIAHSSLSGKVGRSFGWHRAMDTSGAVLGLILAAIIIYSVQGWGYELSFAAYRWLVVAGVVPALLAVLVLWRFVREADKNKPQDTAIDRIGFLRSSLAGFDTRFKVFLVVIGVFTLGNSSDFFVILRAQNLSVPLITVIMMLVLFNVTYALVAMPAGIVSDRLGRRRVIAFGWVIYAFVYLGFAVVSAAWQTWLLFAVYGVYQGLVEGVARAFVADLVPEERRGTAYGLYHGVVGLALLPASLIAGLLWDAVSPAAPFYLGAGLAFLAALGLVIFVRERRGIR